GAVRVRERKVVGRLDGCGDRIGENGVLLVADLGQARWQREVLGIDRVDDVRRRQAPGLKLCWIDIDHDLPVLSSVRGRERDAWNRGQLLTQVVVAVIVKLLLIESIGSQAKLQDRNARGIVTHDYGRLDSSRQEHAYIIRSRNDLCDGQVDVDVRLKEDLLDRNAIQRLRFHILDAGYARADSVLAVGADALLHLRRA